jgi:hypothetical protein
MPGIEELLAQGRLAPAIAAIPEGNSHQTLTLTRQVSEGGEPAIHHFRIPGKDLAEKANRSADCTGFLQVAAFR